MSRSPTLRRRLTWWFGASLLALYGTAAFLGWLYAASTTEQQAVLNLKAEAEDVAAMIEGGGAVAVPELEAPEDAPIPVWVRVVRDGRVVAATPNLPDVPVVVPRGARQVMSVSRVPGPAALVVVRHRAGPLTGATWVEVIGSLEPLASRSRRLGATLTLVGLVLIPVAVLGGRDLAARAMRPVDALVMAILALDPRRMEQRLTPPRDAVDEVTVLAAAFNDLLGRLEANVETMRRFTADASHEIRNPLSVLRAGIEIALRRERSPEEYRVLLGENLEEIDRLHAVVEGLLALARGDAGAGYQPAWAPVDLSALVHEAARRFETVAAEGGIRIDVEAPPGVAVQGEEGLLRLSVFNLLDNALKHGPAGETVRVTLARSAGGARLVVADRGPGIPPEARPRLFERFARGRGGGVGGLGLSVVRWVAEAHRGSVRLLDTDQGAAFELSLPDAPSVAPAGPVPAPERVMPIGTRS